MTNLPKLNATTSVITLPTMTCYRHPTTETLLRCNRCNRPICATCSRQTDVGYRCPECIDQIHKRYLADRQGNVNPYHAPADIPFFTYRLAAMIVAIWLLTTGERIFFNSYQILSWGMSYGPSLVAGEYWRLLTPIFFHGNESHLLFNTIALLAFGPTMEKLYHRYRFLLIYLFAGLYGNLFSLAYYGLREFSLGASGAIFGIVGMQLAFFTRYRQEMGAAGQRQRQHLWLLIGINVLLGIAMGNVNHVAHLGGLVAGFILGYALAPRYTVDQGAKGGLQDHASLRRRWWVFALMTVLFLAGLMGILHGPMAG